jgi:hypothetical protein
LGIDTLFDAGVLTLIEFAPLTSTDLLGIAMLPESAFALAGHNEITNVSDENNRESGLLMVAPEPTLTGKATINVAVVKHNKSKRAKVFMLAI